MISGLNQRINEEGNAYGSLLVVRADLESRKANHTYWLCQCSCGSEFCKEEVTVQGTSLRNGKTTNCGTRKGSKYKDPLHGSINRIVTTYKRAARDRGIQWSLSISECRDIFLSPCSYCGDSGSNTLSYNVKHVEPLKYNGIDRVDNDVGYLEGNVVPCCKVCNRAKAGMSVSDFRSWMARLRIHSGD